jgi:hypothetical protein
MEFLKVKILSNKFKPTKYSIHKSFKEQIFESGEDSKIIKTLKEKHVFSIALCD